MFLQSTKSKELTHPNCITYGLHVQPKMYKFLKSEYEKKSQIFQYVSSYTRICACQMLVDSFQLYISIYPKCIELQRGRPVKVASNHFYGHVSNLHVFSSKPKHPIGVKVEKKSSYFYPKNAFLDSITQYLSYQRLW